MKNYSRYITGNIAKWAKRIHVHMKPTVFKPSNTKSALSFLKYCKCAFDSNGIYEESATCLFSEPMKELAEAFFPHRMTATKTNEGHREGNLIIYSQVSNYLLQSYATDVFNAKAEADIMNYEQDENMSAVCYSKALWRNVLIFSLFQAQSFVHRRNLLLDTLHN